MATPRRLDASTPRRLDASTPRRLDASTPRRLIAMLAGLGGVMLGPSNASADATRVCLDLDLDAHLKDASERPPGEGPLDTPPNNDDYLEDYGRIETQAPLANQEVAIEYAFPAQRWLVRVLDDAGVPLWGFSPLDGEGCTGANFDVEYDPGATLTVEYVRWAAFSNDRHVVGYDCYKKAEQMCRFGLPGEPLLSDAGTYVITGVVPQDNDTTYATVPEYITPDDEEDTGLPSEPQILSPSEYLMYAVTFAEEYVPVWPNEAFQVYVAHDFFTDGPLVGPASARAFTGLGGALGLAFEAQLYRSKTIIAHEFGHVQSALKPGMPLDAADYCHDPMELMPCSHNDASVEWQSAAAIEGFADAYAVFVWNDPTEAFGYVANTGDKVRVRYPSDDDPVCMMACGPGEANEYDWASALYELQRDTGLTTAQVMELLSIAYQGTWVGADCTVETCDTNVFWNNFVQEMSGASFVTAQDVVVWAGIGAAWEIDQ